jgi:phosphoribosyl 1,2-cyclic phosphodiesterase
MGLTVNALNSGSNGNCYYVGNEEDAVLVDAGISCREVETRMKKLGLQPEKIRAIFISHEHADHIRGVPVLANKYGIPVFSTPQTRRRCGFRIRPELVCNFTGETPVTIGTLTVHPFSKVHDAADPYSFTISGNGINVGVFTDLGVPCASLVRHFSSCHAAFLESNYDADMLEAGRYPFYLKQRIRGGQGHLSNEQALALYKDHRPPYMSHLILSHLSHNNNCPKLVQEMFSRHAGNTTMVVASRFEATPLYHITGDAAAIAARPLLPSEQQLALF